MAASLRFVVRTASGTGSRPPGFRALALLFLSAMTLLPGAWAQQNVVRIAVLAHRGEEAAMESWSPTAQYLTAALPPYTFTIVPLMNATLGPAVEREEVDFVLTNPGSYVNLETKYGVTRMLTLRNLRQGRPYTQFGAVIFTRADRHDIQKLTDLKGRSFLGVRKEAFGGFQMAWRELAQAGIDPFRNFSRLEFSGLPQDTIVYAVRDRKVDAGTVRTDTLERMAAEGKIDIRAFRIVNLQQHANFPFMASTRLYPEWAFARLRHTPEELAQKVTVALLQLPADHPAARAGQSAGWTVPLDYTPVHELFRELQIGPYEEIRKAAMQGVVQRYWLVALAAFVALMLLSGATVYVMRLNRRLKASQQQLLETTGQLEASNTALTRLSAVDGLTRVANRRIFDEALEKEWARAVRTNTAMSVIMVDIDLFKAHNDTYGHQAGDECLRLVAAVLKDTAKRPGDLVARYGGEEFGIVLPGVDGRGAMVVAEKMRRAVEGLKLPHINSITGRDVTISLGVATAFPARGGYTHDLVASADAALYQAKAVGRNQVILAQAAA
jgi:diguanylate cyclase (GGDEF)-like protein